MNTQEEIVEFLKETYAPEAIILHGSRASGNATEKADWDLVLVTKKEEKNGPVLFKEEKLDLDFVHPDEEMLINSHGYPLAQAMLLDDANGIGERLIEQTQQARQAGKILSDEERNNRKQRLERTIERLERWCDNRLVSFGYEALFYQLVVRYWFELRGEFPENIKEAIETFKEKDPKFSGLLEKFIEEKEKAGPAGEIYMKLF